MRRIAQLFNAFAIDAPIFKHDLMEYCQGDGFYRKDLQPGNARWVDNESGTAALSYCCPCGCGAVNQIPVYTTPQGCGWSWNGNHEKPTLKPSLQMLTKCRWHGHVTEGKFHT